MICPKCYPNQPYHRRISNIIRDLHKPHTNLTFAARYLAWLKDRLGPDETLLMAAYNGGPNHPIVRYIRKVKQAQTLYTSPNDHTTPLQAPNILNQIRP